MSGVSTIKDTQSGTPSTTAYLTGIAQNLSFHTYLSSVFLYIRFLNSVDFVVKNKLFLLRNTNCEILNSFRLSISRLEVVAVNA